MNKVFSIIIASALLMSSAVTFATEEVVTPPAEAATAQPGIVAINPANPAFIMTLMNPVTHEATHEVMKNPANWVQFMQPQFYMQMANPANATAWMNPAVYQSMMNPAMMMSWMQPNTIMREISSAPVATMANPATYMPFMNPAIAQPWMNPASYGAAATQMDPAASAQNMFDMSAWTNMFQPVVPKAEETKEQG